MLTNRLGYGNQDGTCYPTRSCWEIVNDRLFHSRPSVVKRLRKQALFHRRGTEFAEIRVFFDQNLLLAPQRCTVRVPG
jgi:hypothetical protein